MTQRLPHKISLQSRYYACNKYKNAKEDSPNLIHLVITIVSSNALIVTCHNLT